MKLSDITRVRPHAPALMPGLVVLCLLLVWAAHSGGYNPDTWYWGALVALALLSAVAVGFGSNWPHLSRARAIPLAAFALYVAWSYLSITWAQSKGDALEGSNRALLYLLLFTVLFMLPWTAEGALIMLLGFVIGVGLIGIVILVRLASADHVQQLVLDGRLAAPTGYYNSTVALFFMDAVAAIVLAARRDLHPVLRGGLVAIACVSLQLSLMGQSRGWLFTLPFVVLASIAVAHDRMRVAAAALIPIAAVLAPVHRLLRVFDSSAGPSLNHAAATAGRTALAICGAMFIAATLLAWADTKLEPPSLSPRRRRQLGIALAALAVATGGAGGVIATHGDPVGFVKRQWQGFTNASASNAAGTHFGQVGSGRYDFWRVSLDALIAHPLQGLGQDNFTDYYLPRRHTDEEPRWTHSIEFRLLAHTGLVGFALFATFVVAGLLAVLRSFRRGPPANRAIAGACLVPLIVWLIHGSVDWFWEIPALSGPALGFFAIAIAVAREGSPAVVPERSPGRISAQLRRIPRPALVGTGVAALLAAVVVLGFPYLAVRETAVASALRGQSPPTALSDLNLAAKLNPLNAGASRLGGLIALQEGQFFEAERRFRQAIARERGGWFPWLGDGLAASQLGDRTRAQHDFEVARSINRRQPAVAQALARVNSPHPMTIDEAFRLLVLVT